MTRSRLTRLLLLLATVISPGDSVPDRVWAAAHRSVAVVYKDGHTRDVDNWCFVYRYSSTLGAPIAPEGQFYFRWRYHSSTDLLLQLWARTGEAARTWKKAGDRRLSSEDIAAIKIAYGYPREGTIEVKSVLVELVDGSAVLLPSLGGVQ